MLTAAPVLRYTKTWPRDGATGVAGAATVVTTKAYVASVTTI